MKYLACRGPLENASYLSSLLREGNRNIFDAHIVYMVFLVHQDCHTLILSWFGHLESLVYLYFWISLDLLGVDFDCGGEREWKTYAMRMFSLDSQQGLHL